MHNSIADFLRTSHTCLLLVHLQIHRLEDTADQLLSTYGWPRLSVGQELGDVLLSESPQNRSRVARQWMPVRLGDVAPGPALCTEIDLLFDPTLELDPLGLLRDVSRLSQMVVVWPGSYQGDVLTYAVPEHSHYRTWRKPEVPIAVLE
ncbi:MAG: BREX-3 system P-loop-containing protein BrxF [Chloroflexi bacterium]|nr:BREX-3 system P-loop-containing protein BrxF [Chloroflexota bacterium]